MTLPDKYPQERLVSYDRSWATLYAGYEARLKACLGGAWEIEHVGSTSVPGLLAKPVIDLAIRMPQGATPVEANQRLVSAGWSEPFRVGGHCATVLPASGVRAAIGHLFTPVQWPQAHVRLFADWLRRHDEDRDRYAELKQHLVERGAWGTEYTDAKGSFVQSIVNRARADLGLPGVTLTL
jgi:GrpB-like predicted nucleotidyltransferase (UPF0157 family)